MQVVTVPKTEPPFLVLENMVGSHQKGVHVISMSSKKDLKLVRNAEIAAASSGVHAPPA